MRMADGLARGLLEIACDRDDLGVLMPPDQLNL
jgi:hypothetical protein